MEKNSSYKKEVQFISNVEIHPECVEVRTFCTITIFFQLKTAIPQSSTLIFRFRGGRNNKNDWYYLQANDPHFNGYAKLKFLENRAIKTIPLVITGKELSIHYFVAEKEGIPKDMWVEFSIHNTLAQSFIEQNKKIEILLGNLFKYPYLLKELPKFTVISSHYTHLNLICPSIVFKEEKFTLLIRCEDKYHNLVDHTFSRLRLYRKKLENKQKTLMRELENIHIKEGILFINHLQLQDEGIYCLELEYNSEVFESNIITCKSQKNQLSRLFWGFIHGHTNKSDGINRPENYFENLIKSGLDFGTSTEHDHTWETSDEDLIQIKELVKAYNAKDNFVSFFGYEYGTWYSGYGDICIYHKNDNIPILRSGINKYNSTPKLIKNLLSYKGQVLMIAHHTALRPGYRNWDYFDPSLEKLVEIYSTWGNQEYPFSEGNPIPPRYKFFGYGKYARKRGAILGREGSYVKDALQRGYKLGFIAGGDDHVGEFPSGPIDLDNGIYPSGIMAVWSNAQKLNKEDLWNSMVNRKCYGTTGVRAIIQFWLDSFFMGDIIDLLAKENTKLLSTRVLKIKIYSNIQTKKLQLIRNNIIYAEKNINSKIINLQFIDNDPFNTISLETRKPLEKELFCYYYPRIFLEQDHMAWASPIWLIRKEKNKKN
ncbi:MAG: hypothetical protein BAJALOKI1v1_730006 [Promethearchaeota archaeon]|nr:MAG: hypothetical protein BAJALOKI1v1_730006 [Candidatus Lokiarchaeota archaeon]